MSVIWVYLFSLLLDTYIRIGVWLGVDLRIDLSSKHIGLCLHFY
jgi:hypothetical protein